MFTLFASPWWVNLLILVPFAAYFMFKKRGLDISKRQLLYLAAFGIGFGFMEAAAVIYLRAGLGFALNSSPMILQPQLLTGLPKTLLSVEFFRELATLIMLVSASLVTTQKFKERFAVFLWIFAAWDLMYYLGLWLAVRWPTSLTSPDVLFLIPVPWYSQVWFPILVSLLSMLAVSSAISKNNPRS